MVVQFSVGVNRKDEARLSRRASSKPARMPLFYSGANTLRIRWRREGPINFPAPEPRGLEINSLI
jgi:hypothetical protein